MQGTFLKSIDGIWSAKDGAPVPTDPLVVVGQEIVDTLWEDGRPAEYRREADGALLDDVTATNDAIDKQFWRPGPNGVGLQGPWSRQFYVWLFNPANGSMYTYANSTYGAERALNELRNSTRWTSRYRQQDLVPVVRLDDAPMPTKYGGKRRPHFEVVEFIARWANEPAKLTAAVEAAPQLASPVAPPITAPSLAEEMADEIPETRKPIRTMSKGAMSPPFAGDDEDVEDDEPVARSKPVRAKIARR